MKILSLLLVIVLLFSISSCGITSMNDLSTKPSADTSQNSSDDTSQNSSDDTSTKVSNKNTAPATCAHSWNFATCTEPKTCSKCNETAGVALGHTTNSGICSRCGENFSSWETGEYKDEFDQPTGEKYMCVKTHGTFSNSATTDSDLYAALQIDKKNIAIMMWEYNKYLLKGTFDYENYNITILDENGTKHYFTGTIYKSGTRIYFDDDDRADVLKLLKNNDTLKIYLKSTKYSISTYLFTVNTKGFDEIYNQIK